MKGNIIIYLFLTILLVACTKHNPQEDEIANTNGTEDITIRISSVDTQTKSAKDGDVMNNLRIWLVKRNETTAKYYSNSQPYATEAEVVFNNIERGEYTMYIIANSKANSSYVQGSTIDNTFLNATLPPLNAANKPDFNDENGMPLTLIKDIQVTAGVNQISAEIVRVCGKIRVTVHNKVSNKKVYISSFRFTEKNPSNGYLFHHNHEVPPGTTYGEFSSLNANSGAEAVGINKGSDIILFEQYLYESGAIALGIDISGALYPADFTGTPSLGMKDIEKWKFKDNETTNTTIQTGDHWYIIVNAYNERIFLYDNNSTLAAVYSENNDEEFLVKMNKNESQYLRYLWNFSNNTNNGKTQIRNYGANKNGNYIKLSNNNIEMSTKQEEVSTNIYNNNWRRFYFDGPNYYGYNNDYYLYYSDALLLSNDDNNNRNKNRGWYLREMVKETTSELQFIDDGVKNFVHSTDELQYIDDYGTPITLNKICRNELLDIHLNVFHSESTGKLYFEVTKWQTEENKNTTFD